MLGKWILDLKIKYYEFITRKDVAEIKSSGAFDWDKLIHLDAETLAEEGMKEAYEALLPTLKKYVKEPAKLTKIEFSNSDDYVVELKGNRWVIFDDKTQTSGDAWVNAAVAFFEIINSQLNESDRTFYAFYGSNDFSGMFLTQKEFELGRSNFSDKNDWPYIPTHEPKYNGRPH